MSPARLPDKKMKAFGSGRQFNLQNFGTTTVLIFHFQDSAEMARDLNNSLRKKYPLASDLLIGSVLDLHSVPKIARGATEAMVNREYKKAAEGLKDDQAPEDFIIILADWNGQMTKALGFKDTNKQVGLTVLDADGHVLNTYQGNDPMEDIFPLLEDALN